jgi:isocitrate lyase
MHDTIQDQDQEIELTNDWNTNPRWQGITRRYSASHVVRLRGSIQLHYTLAHMGATRLWHLLSTEPRRRQ